MVLDWQELFLRAHLFALPWAPEMIGLRKVFLFIDDIALTFFLFISTFMQKDSMRQPCHKPKDLRKFKNFVAPKQVKLPLPIKVPNLNCRPSKSTKNPREMQRQIISCRRITVWIRLPTVSFFTHFCVFSIPCLLRYYVWRTLPGQVRRIMERCILPCRYIVVRDGLRFFFTQLRGRGSFRGIGLEGAWEGEVLWSLLWIDILQEELCRYFIYLGWGENKTHYIAYTPPDIPDQLRRIDKSSRSGKWLCCTMQTWREGTTQLYQDQEFRTVSDDINHQSTLGLPAPS